MSAAFERAGEVVAYTMSAASGYESAEHATNLVLRDRIVVAMTMPHTHPGVPGLRDGGGCPRCNAEHALRELLRRAV